MQGLVKPWSMPSSLRFKLSHSHDCMQLLFSAHVRELAVIITLYGDRSVNYWFRVMSARAIQISGNASANLMDPTLQLLHTGHSLPRPLPTGACCLWGIVSATQVAVWAATHREDSTVFSHALHFRWSVDDGQTWAASSKLGVKGSQQWQLLQHELLNLKK